MERDGTDRHGAGESGRRPTLGEGLRSGIGVLAAFRDAIEETIQEAGERGDLSPERAKAFLGTALHRAQETVGDVRERLELVPRRDFEALRAEVAELRRRLEALEGSRPLALPPAPEGPAGPAEARIP